jgi:MFS family permease
VAGRRLFQSRWWVVFASVFGLIGGGAMTVFVFSVFLRPLTETFGWTRGEVSGALAASSLVGAITSPIIGKLIDSKGVRVVVLTAIVAFSALTASVAFLAASLAMLYGLYILIGIAGAGQSPVPYSKAIAGWFDDKRGLALGIAIAGSGVGTAVMPQLAQALTTHFGWRAGYLGLAATFFVVAFPIVALFLREPPAAEPGHAAFGPMPGLTMTEAARSWRFWILVVAFFLSVTPVNGVITQAIALLGDRGMSVREAAAGLSTAGVVAIVSRLVAGFCLDRVHAPFVGVAFFGTSTVGMAMLAFGATGNEAVAGAALCGVGIGAEVDLVAFLITRYFGMRAFGTIYGYVFAVLPIGVGVGAALMGATYDRAHSYQPMLVAFTVMLVVACALLATLGPYAYPRVAGPVARPALRPRMVNGGRLP